MATSPLDCCHTIIGGQIDIKIAPELGDDFQGPPPGPGGLPGELTYHGMGDARIQPTTSERTAGMTNGGVMWITVAPRVARVVMDFANKCDNGKLPIWDLIRPEGHDCKLRVTIREKDRGWVHVFSQAAIVGFAEFNLSTGVVSGLELVSDQYRNYSENPPQEARQ